MNTPNKQILIEILNKNYLNSKKLIETSLNNKIKVLLEDSAPPTRTETRRTPKGNIIVGHKTAKSHYSDPILKSPWHWANPLAVPIKLLDLFPADDEFDWYNPVDLIKGAVRGAGGRDAGTQIDMEYEIPDFKDESSSNNPPPTPTPTPAVPRVKRERNPQGADINEEIVNPKNKGTMTKPELGSRDRIAKKVKANPIKGKDTKENAQYRLATYITIKNRKGDK